jgi:predicted SnoaL-like aldol condensation-catalyzing enzyme
MRRALLIAAAGVLTLACWDTLNVAIADTAVPRKASLAPPAAPIVAGEPVAVVGHAEPLSLLASDDPVLAANKRLVFDLWRSVVNAGHVEVADRLLTEDYIQHSPVLPTGRAAFKKIFSAVPRRDPIPDVVQPPLIAIVAERDLVAMMLVEKLQESRG